MFLFFFLNRYHLISQFRKFLKIVKLSFFGDGLCGLLFSDTLIKTSYLRTECSLALLSEITINEMDSTTAPF